MEKLTQIRRKHTTENQSKKLRAARKRCRSLIGFVSEAWKHIPELANVEYVHGWHILLICMHLEAITSGRVLELNLENRLLINVPPGMMKSLLVSVFWPAWEWGPCGLPHLQYITTSYREDLCRRDTRRMRDLVNSGWYQSLWGANTVIGGRKISGVELVAKGETRISNTAGGWREGIPFDSLTGGRADRLIIDDPHSLKTAEFEAYREQTVRQFREFGAVPGQRSEKVGDRRYHAALACR